MSPTTPDTQGPPRPDLDAGLKYWNAVAQKDVSNNAVLGGFGLGVSCFLPLSYRERTWAHRMTIKFDGDVIRAYQESMRWAVGCSY